MYAVTPAPVGVNVYVPLNEPAGLVDAIQTPRRRCAHGHFGVGFDVGDAGIPPDLRKRRSR